MYDAVKLIEENRLEDLKYYLEDNLPIFKNLFFVDNNLRDVDKLKALLVACINDAIDATEELDSVDENGIYYAKSILYMRIGLCLDVQIGLQAEEDRLEFVSEVQDQNYGLWLQNRERAEKAVKTIQKNNEERDQEIKRISSELRTQLSISAKAQLIHDRWDEYTNGAYKQLSIDRIRKILSK
jgi:chaperonin cofactor prefoldin